MINFSSEFKRELANDNRKFIYGLKITLQDGTQLEVTNDDLWDSSFSLSDGTSASGSFTVGGCVSGKLTFTLNNIYEKFSGYNFFGAMIKAYIGLEFESELVGTFYVDEPKYNGSLINITAVDSIHKLDIPFSEVPVTYPIAADRLVTLICNTCGVAVGSVDLPLNYTVNQAPRNSQTCANILANIAQIEGRFVKTDVNGRICIRWYDTDFLKDKDLDGGTFKYTDGDKADGGNFTDYSSGDKVDGGGFLTPYHVISTLSTLSVGTDDIVVTGVQVTALFPNTETDDSGNITEPTTILVGTNDYLYDISNNPLIQTDDNARVVANHLYSVLNGVTFRNCDVAFLADPSIEAGDVGYVNDTGGRLYKVFISNRRFKDGAYENISCDAETPLKNSQRSYSSAGQVLQFAKELIANEKSAREIAIEAMGEEIANANGFYTTEVVESGAKIVYMHNKPLLAESAIQWKITSTTMSVSTDYGKTFTLAINASGDAIVQNLYGKTLYGTYISGDYVYGGTIGGSTIQSVGDGTTTIQGGKLTTNNAEITGGSINITAQDDLVSAIKLASIYGSSNSLTAAGVEILYNRAGVGYTQVGRYSSGGVRLENSNNESAVVQTNMITTSGYVQANGTGTFSKIYQTNPDENTSYNANARITADGRIIKAKDASSKKFKTDITDEFTDELDPHKLYDLSVKQFKFIDGFQSDEDKNKGKDLIGFIAEEVNDLYPVATFYDENGDIENWNIRYIVPPMLKLIQEQKQEIDDLKERISRLESMFNGNTNA